MGRLEHSSPFRTKTHKKSTKVRSSLSEDIFRRALADQRIVRGNAVDTPSASKLTRSRRRKNDDSMIVLKDTFDELIASPESTKSNNTETEAGDEDWLNGVHLFAQYNDSDPATEEERVAALLDDLQGIDAYILTLSSWDTCVAVSFQKSTLQLKQGLCNSLLKTLNDIRQIHVSVDSGPDVNRGKGIVIYNSACDKRHTDAQRLQAELQDNLPEKQAEIKQLFGQIKQCYVARKELWTNLEAKLGEITNKQTHILDRIDRETAEAMANFDKKYAHMLKGDSLKSKEKLLRDVLDKL